MRSSSKPLCRVLLGLCAAAAMIVLILLFWGGGLLIASDALPDHADEAVVLQGSMIAEKTRIAGAMTLLQQGVVSRVAISIPNESYWGQSLAPVARTYVERIYGADVAGRVDFCVTGSEVDSTADEAHALGTCLAEHQWRTVVIVTSNYHSHRAGMIWRNAIKKEHPEIRVWVDGVTEPGFQRQWWRSRRSAKIWLEEFSKLVLAALGG